MEQHALMCLANLVELLIQRRVLSLDDEVRGLQALIAAGITTEKTPESHTEDDTTPPESQQPNPTEAEDDTAPSGRRSRH